jgi:hypothetical protein
MNYFEKKKCSPLWINNSSEENTDDKKRMDVFFDNDPE